MDKFHLWMDCSKTVNLAPFNQFLDFLFPSYSRFFFKKKSLTCQKSFPPPHWGHRLPVIALGLSGWMNIYFMILTPSTFNSNEHTWSEQHRWTSSQASSAKHICEWMMLDGHDDAFDVCRWQLTAMMKWWPGFDDSDNLFLMTRSCMCS